jgi:hypothetical protein
MFVPSGKGRRLGTGEPSPNLELPGHFLWSPNQEEGYAGRRCARPGMPGLDMHEMCSLHFDHEYIYTITVQS